MAEERRNVQDMNYFELLAWLGVGSSHPGGFQATKENLKALEIKKEEYILDAGCGTGLTACHLARTIGCRVVGIDINSEMIEKAQRRVEREGLSHLVEFQVADVYRLPFLAASFDLVVAESLTVFLNKQKAYREFFRVLKPGGRLADLEMAIVKELPEEIEAEMRECYGQTTNPLPFTGWVQVLQAAGFEYLGVLNPQYLRPGSGFMLQEIKKDWILLKDLAQKIKEPGLLDRLQKSANFNRKNQGYFGFGLIYGKKPDRGYRFRLKDVLVKQ